LMGNGAVYLIGCLPWTPVGQRKAATAMAFLLGLFAIAGVVRDVVKPFKTTAELWNREFVNELMERIGPQDKVVLFHAPQGLRPGLEWYFRQHDDRVNWQGRIDWDWVETGVG